MHYYCFSINIPIINIFFLSFQLPVSSFYAAKPRTSTRLAAARAQEEARTLAPYVVPNNCGDSDLEIEDDTLVDDFDDDVLDSDFFLDLQDDHLTPTASGKH